MPWRRRQDRHRDLCDRHGERKALEVESRGERRSPEPGHLTGGHARRRRRRHATGTAEACRSMPSRRAKEVSIGTKWTCPEGGWSRPRGEQRPRSSTPAPALGCAVLRSVPHPWPRLREANVVRTWSPPSQPRSIGRGREARVWATMAHGRRARQPREAGPEARLTGANEGAVALAEAWARWTGSLGQVSDNESQFSERVGQTEGRTDIGPEIVEAPAEVLDEGMGSDDHPGGTISLQSSHGSKPGLQASVVSLDGVVGVDLRVMEGRGEQVIDDAGVRSIPVGGDLHW